MFSLNTRNNENDVLLQINFPGRIPYNVPVFCFMAFTTIKGIKIVPFFKQIGQFPHEITLLKNWEFARGGFNRQFEVYAI